MARFLVVVLVAVCYIACVSAQGLGLPPADYYPVGSCDLCDSNGRGTRLYRGPLGQSGYYLCYECDPVLSLGQTAGIVVGAIVLLFLIIMIILGIRCFFLGCDCDNGLPRGPGRWDSEDSMYVTPQAMQPVNPQFIQVAPQQTTFAPSAQPTIQVIKAPNFQSAVIQQQSPQVIQVPSTGTATTPQITFLS